MLTRIDRVLITAHDAAAVANRWVELLDAQPLREDAVAVLGAKRIVLGVGDAELEILQPTQPGPIARHLAAGGGAFAAGVATRNIHRMRRRFAEAGIVPTQFGQQFLVDAGRLGVPGLNVVVSPHVDRPRYGLMTNLYEVTHLTGDPNGAAAAIARMFDLKSRNFVPIHSAAFGYDGVLTLFDPDALHRIETINPFDRTKTMGRYFDRYGPRLYMCYGETDRLSELRDRLKRLAPSDWTGNDADQNGLFVHPRALGGAMLGVSRETYAWTWSGRPDRVKPL
ncbi:MAG TPA: hypothetical protein VFG38_01100 [Pseudomonadales bacterium]|nr:hypothetical protein [Pseudomonadales bacterium]